MPGDLKIFGGRSHPALVQEICEYLNLSAGNVSALNFSDGEIFCQIDENVRGSDVFIVQPTCEPVNENLMELLILLDAFKRSSASRVTAVIPYYGYARQDKKDRPRVPITAKLVADLISRAGADRVLTMDLHADQIQGFFDVPVDHLFAAPVILEAVHKLALPDLVIVSPDAGGVERARAIAKRLDVGLAIVDKRRTAPNTAEVMHVIGDVEGCNTLIIDDIIDTAGTLTKTVEALKGKGARRILAAGTHGVLSGPALTRINESPLEAVLITNTIPVENKLSRTTKLRTLSVAPLLGEAIKRIHENSSVSSLFV
ncbi:MAG: ribose-phosphate pyrophosphokinae [Acidobacteriota bacterium]|jgi:ribose-phosphate pyrophosphokinase|nr:ribose-phosphate pyrophosphokinae [Acidobacteriota bacterium]